mgnify:CR=1 FL=1
MFVKNNFLKRQNLQFKELGLTKFTFIKLVRLVKLALLPFVYILIFPIFLMIYFISFFYPIRFGKIHNGVVGHYIFDVEYYLSYKKKNKIKSLDLFFLVSNNSANLYWDIIVKRNLNISFIYKYFFFIAKYFSKKNIILLNPITVRDVEDVLHSTPIQIKFTENEIEDGLNILKKMGKGINQKYICVVNRDDAYRKKYFGKSVVELSEISLIRHKHRNSNIDDYAKAINYFLEKGFFVIRMGKITEKKLNINNKNFIDYSCSEFKSDFLDIFLFYNSHLNLVSESGILLSSMIFRKPTCSVNCADIGGLQLWNNEHIIIFKKYWSKKRKKFLSIKEIIELSKEGLNSHLVKKRSHLIKEWKEKTNKNLFLSLNEFIRKNRGKIFTELDKDGKVIDNKLGMPMGNYGLLEFHRDKDIEIIDNTSEEIKDVCEELNQRISDEWIEKKEDRHLQEKFWNEYPKDLYVHGAIRSRIGNNFLKKNNFLLGS